MHYPYYPENEWPPSEEEKAFRQLFADAARKNLWLIDDHWVDEEIQEAETKLFKEKLWASTALLVESIAASYYLHVHDIYNLHILFLRIRQALADVLTPEQMTKVEDLTRWGSGLDRRMADDVGLEFFPVSYAIIIIFCLFVPGEFYADLYSSVVHEMPSYLRSRILDIFRGGERLEEDD